MTDSSTPGLAPDRHRASAPVGPAIAAPSGIMVVVLIPLAVWTIAGLIALWPKDVRSHINSEGITFGVAGVSYPAGRVTNVARISCEGVPGSTSGVNTQVCANLSVQVLGGEDQGKTVVVPVTHVIYASGISIGQRVSLVRIPPIDGQPAPVSVLRLQSRYAAARLHPHLRGGGDPGRALARLRGAARARRRRLILVTFLFPALVSGANPILVGLIASSAILFVALFAAHGLNVATTTALIGSLAALLAHRRRLGFIATRWAHLTGIATEERLRPGRSGPGSGPVLGALVRHHPRRVSAC